MFITEVGEKAFWSHFDVPSHSGVAKIKEEMQLETHLMKEL